MDNKPDNTKTVMLSLFLDSIMKICLILERLTFLQKIVHLTSNLLQFFLPLDLTDNDCSSKQILGVVINH